MPNGSNGGGTRGESDQTETAPQLVVGVFSVRRDHGLGLIGLTGYQSTDGRSLAMAFFENRGGMLAWKREVEHAAAQQRGRAEFFMIDAYDFETDHGRRQVTLDSQWRPAGFEGPAGG